MTSNGFNQFRFNLSGLGCWLALIGFVWLLGSIGLGWLIKSLVVIVALVSLAPILIFVGLRFWLKQNLVQADCPVCDLNLTGLRHTETICPSCGTPLKAEDGQFKRITDDDGTIDVQAVDVTVEQLPESASEFDP